MPHPNPSPRGEGQNQTISVSYPLLPREKGAGGRGKLKEDGQRVQNLYTIPLLFCTFDT